MNQISKAFANILFFIYATIPLESIAAKTKSIATKKIIIEQQVTDSDIIRHFNTTPILLKSRQAIVIDFDTGIILLEKKPFEKMLPSSMTKMMTSYIIQEKIKKAEISYDSQFPVSEKAWRIGGSKTFVSLGDKVRVEDLLRGIIIQSGNDACIVAAEGLYGSEELFVNEMNAKAQELGMKNTNFMNSSGWPEENHYSTAYDLALLGIALIKDHPDFYSLYSEKTFTFGKDQKGRPITQGNRNTLLYKEIGCDGIKTGHTEDGGFGIAASFIDNGKRYIMVINGLSSMKERSSEAEILLNWVKHNFINKKLFAKGDIVEKEAKVLFGMKEAIPLILKEDVMILIPRLNQNNVNIKLEYASPIKAPIKEGDLVGKMVINIDNKVHETTIIAGESVEEIGVFSKIMHSVKLWLFGK